LLLPLLPSLLLGHDEGGGHLHSCHVHSCRCCRCLPSYMCWSRAFLPHAFLLLMGHHLAGTDQQLTVPLAVTEQRSMGAAFPCTCT
jgi:hypothetical protein